NETAGGVIEIAIAPEGERAFSVKLAAAKEPGIVDGRIGAWHSGAVKEGRQAEIRIGVSLDAITGVVGHGADRAQVVARVEIVRSGAGHGEQIAWASPNISCGGQVVGLFLDNTRTIIVIANGAGVVGALDAAAEAVIPVGAGLEEGIIREGDELVAIIVG